jgi:formate hydrogenlyase transcriptional activator
MQKHIDRIPKSVMNELVSHSWPGNIRELQNVIERSVILTRGNSLCPPLAKLPTPQSDPSEPPTTLRDTERAIISTLQQTNGIIDGPRGAAARLGVKRTTLYSRMQKLGIARAKGG